MTKRATFVSTVSRLLDEDEHVYLLLGDISTWAFREAAAKHPTRVLNMGVCEQAMVGFAAGLALAGYYPIIHTIESFLVRRAYEFIRLDFGEQRLRGLFVGIGGANEYAKLGPTHQCPEGSALLRQVPGFLIKEPATSEWVQFWIEGMVRNRELGYIRIEESKTPDLVRSLLEGVDVSITH